MKHAQHQPVPAIHQCDAGEHDAILKGTTLAAAFIIAFASAALPIYLRQRKHSTHHTSLVANGNAFAAGVFLSIGLLHFLPEASTIMAANFGSAFVGKYHPEFVLCILSYSIMVLVQRVVFPTPMCPVHVKGAEHFGDLHHNVHHEGDLCGANCDHSDSCCEGIIAAANEKTALLMQTGEEKAVTTNTNGASTNSTASPINIDTIETPSETQSSHASQSPPQCLQRRGTMAFYGSTSSNNEVVTTVGAKSAAPHTPPLKPSTNGGGCCSKDKTCQAVNVEGDEVLPFVFPQVNNKKPKSPLTPLAAPHAHEGSCCPGDHCVSDDPHILLTKGERMVSGRSTVLLLALSLHGFAEGMALGLQSGASDILLLSGAILSHKWAEAFALGTSIAASASRHTSAKSAIIASLFLICTFSASTPIGIIVGWIAHALFPPAAKGIVNALSAGTFLYIGASEVVVEEFVQGRQYWGKWFWFVSGWVGIYAVHLWMVSMSGH